MFSLTVHQPLSDSPECIKHSQIKRTWRGIYKQQHTSPQRRLHSHQHSCHVDAYTVRHLFSFYTSDLFCVYLPSYRPLGMTLWRSMFQSLMKYMCVFLELVILVMFFCIKILQFRLVHLFSLCRGSSQRPRPEEGPSRGSREYQQPGESF